MARRIPNPLWGRKQQVRPEQLDLPTSPTPEAGHRRFLPKAPSQESSSELPSKRFGLMDFPFKRFNPMQTEAYPYHDQDANLVCAASTSAGKTIVAELFIGHEIFARGNTAMFLSPLKAVSQERFDDWTSDEHGFANLDVSICTGDYQLTGARARELRDADLIVMTSEMLDSRTRNVRAEKNVWLSKVKTLVVDEAHLLTMQGRGDKLEAALMRFSKLNPDCRIVLLSATMPNVEQLAGWLSVLNSKPTNLVNSSFRPVPLEIHFVTCKEGKTYRDGECNKIAAAMAIYEQHEDDRFIMFVHSKALGRMLMSELRSQGIKAQFHSADLVKEDRVKVEKRFRRGKIPVIVATSTLAWGINMPARRVIVLGIHRGTELVSPIDIQQMLGRAGRFGLDDKGDSYVLIPSFNAQSNIAYVKNVPPISSRLLDRESLAFHLVAEMEIGDVRDLSQVQVWFARSLAAKQGRELATNHLQDVLRDMVIRRILLVDQGGTLRLEPPGSVAARFYFDPFTIADWARNFRILFSTPTALEKNWESISVAAALACADKWKQGFLSRDDETLTAPAMSLARTLPPAFAEMGVLARTSHQKALACTYAQLEGMTLPPIFQAFWRGLAFDMGRIFLAIKSLDKEYSWGQEEYLRTLEYRVRYGVPIHLADLCRLKRIGPKTAEKLYDAGFTSLELVAAASNMKELRDVVGRKRSVTLNAQAVLLTRDFL